MLRNDPACCEKCAPGAKREQAQLVQDMAKKLVQEQLQQEQLAQLEIQEMQPELVQQGIKVKQQEVMGCEAQKEAQKSHGHDDDDFEFVEFEENLEDKEEEDYVLC